ncbi:T9SS type A sorting domain-containing protein [Hymenobacter elongatus]|uniref:T9SS type A sorting domain-containing protein n=1 Tax=Hymenobacter elongatus TaxID=877208 RepID=A0A4Z0PQF2_9BACT|nr:T9SS type A sorting domain-containing protein [Hymenobacter elongatus]TGE19356.1 T9SS type A sorting domain-containing protein [Hymenobacter elongatus]
MHFYHHTPVALFLSCAWLLATNSVAQSLQVSNLSPARHASAASRTSAVGVTFGQSPAGTPTLAVFSQQAGGRKAGTTSSVGTTAAFVPQVPFKAGELLTATVTTPSGRHMWQFTAATTGGTGTFGGASFTLPLTPYPYGVIAVNLAVADMNGDNYLDVIVGEMGTNPSGLYLNNGRGQLGSRFASFGASTTVPSFALGDVDGDGDLDLPSFRNDGTGRFTQVVGSPILPLGSSYNRLLVDTDGDSDLDLVYTSLNALYVAPNSGTGVFATPTSLIVPEPGNLTATDLDNDGDLDLLGYGGSGGNGGLLRTFFNGGNGLFTLGATYAAPTTAELTARTPPITGDIDGDGDVDVLLPYYLDGSRVAVSWLNDGTGQLTVNQTITSTRPIMCTSASLADVDSDGDLDLLLNGASRIHVNLGQGIFGPATYLQPATSSDGGLVLADMNNDGALDLVTAQPGLSSGGPNNSTLGYVKIHLNEVVTATSSAVAQALSVWPNPVASGASLQIKLQQPVPAGRVVLRTLLGQFVQEQATIGRSTELITSGVAPGMYLLSVEAPGQPAVMRRICVQ